MGKIKLCVFFSVLAMAFQSCQTDDGGMRSGETDFTVVAGIPSGITTYAGGEGAEAFSHMGGASNIEGRSSEYDLRYTLEVYDEGRLAYETYQIVKDNFVSTPVQFNVRLLAKEYDFVFWADFVKEVPDGQTPADMLYNTADLREISYVEGIDQSLLLQDVADAYYACEHMDLTTASQNRSEILLKRPFGKIRLVATDKPDGVQNEFPVKAKIDFKGAEVPSAFNALLGQVVDGSMMTVNNPFVVDAVCEDVQVKDYTYDNAYLLGFCYFFAGNTEAAYSMDVTVFSDENAGAQIGYRELSGIPVRENMLTTVIGNFYTNEGALDVIVDDMFDSEEVIDVEDLTYPEDGVYNNTTGRTYPTIAEAIAESKDGDILTLAAAVYDEIINIARAESRTMSVVAPASITIVGQQGTKVNGIYVLDGKVTLKNIEFAGAGEAAAQYSTIYVGQDAEVMMEGCAVNAPEGTSGRPVETMVYMSGSFVMDGCTIYNNGRPDSYLNPAAESGRIQIVGCTFVDGSVAAEYRIDAAKTAAYPVVSGNKFSSKGNIGVSDVTAAADASALPRDVKNFINGMIEENVFEVEDQVKVVITPLPYNPETPVIDLVEPISFGPVYNETSGYDYANVRDAVEGARQGDVIVVSEGEYDLGEPGQKDQLGPNGYYLKIDKPGLTLRGEGDVKLYTSHRAPKNIGGSWSLQNLVTVMAENVTVENITFQANYNEYFNGSNKTIEVYSNTGDNFIIRNCRFVSDGTTMDAGCLYIGADGPTTLKATVEKCEFVNSAISVRPNTSANIIDCIFDGVREKDGWNTSVSVRGRSVLSGCDFINCDGDNKSNVINALGSGVVDIEGCEFPSDETYWTSSDDGLILFDGKYPFSGGEGSYEEPYLLSTPEDVLAIGRLYQSGNDDAIYRASFVMTDDIDISATPIRNLGVMSMLFDGNGHTLTVNITSEGESGAGSNVGLFAGFNGAGNSYIYEAKTAEEMNDPKAYEINGKKYIIKAGCIRDLVIRGTVYSNVAGAVSPLGCGQNTGYIINVKNYADVTADGPAYFVAGIVSGTKGTGLVLDCENYGTITVNGKSSVIGGITAQLYGGSNCDGTYPDILAPYSASVKNCKNYGNIVASGSNDVGGIVGQTHGYGYNKCISDCFNEGNISGDSNVGGIIGRHTSTGGTLLLSGNVNRGNISAADGNSGDICGRNDGNLADGSQEN